LHIREADDDALRILHLLRNKLHGGVCHCFTGNAELARKYTNLGLMLGVGGALLSKYDQRRALEEAVANTPIESILLETDGPYVKPDSPGISGKQLRKARNTSLILPAVSSRIAELKGMTQADVEEITSENARRLFNIP
jgi:TatD DNase family protein